MNVITVPIATASVNVSSAVHLHLAEDAGENGLKYASEIWCRMWRHQGNLMRCVHLKLRAGQGLWERVTHVCESVKDDVATGLTLWLVLGFFRPSCIRRGTDGARDSWGGGGI